MFLMKNKTINKNKEFGKRYIKQRNPSDILRILQLKPNTKCYLLAGIPKKKETRRKKNA